MKSMLFPLAVALLCWSLSAAWAEPSWTLTGNCADCHGSAQPGLIKVFFEDGLVDPADNGERKTFVAPQGRTRTLFAEVWGLPPAAGYGVKLSGFDGGGVTVGQPLAYLPDCDWPEWANQTFSEPVFSYDWGIGPNWFRFDLDVSPEATQDHYNLLFAVAGVDNDTDQLFYAEEVFYVQVVPANNPPTVSITAPADGTTIVAGSTDVAVTATAADTDGTIVRVEFYYDTFKLGQDDAAPYSLSWSDMPVGTFRISAKAIDSSGISTVSDPVTLTVRAVPGDFDHDGDVDQADFGLFQQCLAGPDIPPPALGCAEMLLDADTDVDADDWQMMQLCLSGANVPANPECLAGQ